jgi:hypothetical protein
MTFSQMKDERLLLFYEAVRKQVILDGNCRYRFAATQKECEPPVVVSTSERKRLGLRQSRTVVDFVIPAPRR